jgi:tetratricopeptide (TPR) repeat protein
MGDRVTQYRSADPRNLRLRTPIRASVVLAVAVWLGACAAPVPPRVAAPQPVAPEVSQKTAPEADVIIAEPTPADDFDYESDVVYRLLIAEFAGQRAHFDVAIDNYIAVAKELRDVEIAKRAARIAVFARDEEAALEAAKIWVEQAPGDVEARQIIAAMFIRQGDAEAAIEHLEYVLDVASDGEDRQMKIIASLLGRVEDKRTALKVMENLIAKRPDDIDALRAYALLAIRAEDHDGARTAMNKLIETSKIESNLALAYVSLLQKKGRNADAIEWLERAISKNPDEFGLRMMYARMLADLNRYEEARLQFAILVEKTPDNSDVVFALGLLNLQASRVDAAEKNFRRLIELQAREDDAYYYLGQIEESRDSLDDALERYRRVSGGSNYFQAQIRIGFIHSSKGEVDAAREHLHTVSAETSEEEMHLVRAEGEILAEHERFEEAMAVYDEALADGYNMELLYTRAMLAEKIGRIDVLERDLRTILTEEPDNAQALNALGYTLADRTDRYEEAYTLIQRALELNDEDFFILDSMGWVLYRLGRLQEAVTYLEKAQKIKNDPEVAAHLGEVLWVIGDKDAARDVWNNALQDTPEDEKLLDVIERLNP